VLNKIDLLPMDERDARCDEIIDQIGWDRSQPYFKISGLAKENTERMMQAIMAHIKALKEEA
jgi:GTP-binding protein